MLSPSSLQLGYQGSRPMASWLPRGVDIPLIESLALIQAGQRAQNYSDAARERMRPAVLAARARVSASRSLADERNTPAAVALLREALGLLRRALLAERLPEEDAAQSLGAAWRRFENLESKPALPPDALSSLNALLESEDPLYADRLDAGAARELRLSLDAIVAWLAELAEIRTPGQIALARVLRITFGVGFGVLVLVLLFEYVTLLMRLSDPGAS
jgi:hypothetical protein